MTAKTRNVPAWNTAGALKLSEQDREMLHDLYVRGTPENTQRAYERDLVYITAWKLTSFGEALSWPESEDVALRFVLDHSRDLSDASGTDAALLVAQSLIDAGLRRSLACPAPSTLDRRIASWRAFHGMRNIPSPFEAPLVRQTRSKARRAASKPPAPKSARPITRELLEELLEHCGIGLPGLRNRAILLTGWASGGRRRSEITGLRREDIDLNDFDAEGVVWIKLVETKTTAKGKTPRLVLKGTPARYLVAWIDGARINDGWLFRPISKSGRVLVRKLAPDAVSKILRKTLVAAGYPKDYVSPHGLRSGFLTQAALDGAPIQAAMRLSLHRSTAQAQRYYDDVEITENPATDLFD